VGRIIVFVLAVAYVIWPIDLIPDFIPVAGQFDDLIAGAMGLASLVGGAFSKKR